MASQFMTPMNQPDDQSNWLANYLSQRTPAGPLDMSSTVNSPVIPAPMATPIASGYTPGDKRAKSEAKNTQKFVGTQNTFDRAPDVIDMVRNMPEVQDAARSTQGLQDMVNMMHGMKDTGSYWVKPLLSLADAQTGSQMSKDFQDPGNKYDTILKYQDEVNKRKQDMAKTLIDSVSKMKTGTDQNTMMQMLMTGMGGNGQAYQQARLNNLIRQTGKDFDNDKVLIALTQNANSLHRAQSLLTNMNDDLAVDPNTFNASVQDYLKGLQGNANVTEGMVSRELPNALELDLKKLMGYWKPGQDIRTNPDGVRLVNQLLAKMNLINEDYNRAGVKRAMDMANSYQSIPEPEVQATVDRKVGEWKTRPSYQSQLLTGPIKHSTKKAAAAAAAPPALKPTHEMTDDELDAELAKHKGG